MTDPRSAGRPTHSVNPPEVWMPARRIALAVRRPIERFLHVQAASGIVLLAAAAVALIWANSPWHESYEHLWESRITLGIGPFQSTESLHFWINDLLMTVFFLVVGLEIKREMTEGALADVRRAALPVAAAIGGMIVPAGIYLALNTTPVTRGGWGVPMATDIAFAVGVLTLLGNRVPAALRVLLLAVAIIDDIGAIVVIAVFYSSGFALQGVGIVVGGIILLLLLPRMGVRPGWVTILPLFVIWLGLYSTGVHPTLAGVIVGLATPAHSWLGREGFVNVAQEAVQDFEERMKREANDHELIVPLDRIAFARREALSPALRVQTTLHPWVAYLIIPLFALANAGVRLDGMQFDAPGAMPVLFGVSLGLLLGKPAGILLASWIMVKLRIGVLPAGVGWRGVALVGVVAGIGFTMAIFIAELAFVDDTLLAIAKLGILTATAAAGIIGLLMGGAMLRREPPAVLQSLSDSDVESSTEAWVSGTRDYSSPTSERRHPQ